MGLVVSSAVAAGPAVLGDLETPFAVLQERKRKEKEQQRSRSKSSSQMRLDKKKRYIPYVYCSNKQRIPTEKLVDQFSCNDCMTWLIFL